MAATATATSWPLAVPGTISVELHQPRSSCDVCMEKVCFLPVDELHSGSHSADLECFRNPFLRQLGSRSNTACSRRRRWIEYAAADA